MGRTSKFSFPIPGRRHTATITTRDDIRSAPNTPNTPNTFLDHRLSKAQRILGTESNLNIDSPIREAVEDHSWRHDDLRSSGMSISISESTQSTNDEIQGDQWDRESGVLPQDHRMHGKPSSTLLGLNFAEGNAPASADLRHNGSSSTLKSYYDSQKSPLSISQQTSASSSRDLALRKGFPPIHQRSPLLQVESSANKLEDDFREKDREIKEAEGISEKMRKKPAKLDLTKLFPRSRKHGDKSPADLTSSNISPSSNWSNSPRNSSQPNDAGRRKLKKAASKESMQSQKNSIRTSRSHDPQTRNREGTLPDLYDHYENLPVRGPRMDRIPEISIPDRLAARARRDGLAQSKLEVPSRWSNTSETNGKSADRPFSWKNVRSSMIMPTGDTSSAASISSRNTKFSRHTAPSIRSHTDLKDKSVLSLSSDSEDNISDSESNIVTSTVSMKANNVSQQSHSRNSYRSTENDRQSSKTNNGLTARAQSKPSDVATETNQSLLTIPQKNTKRIQIPGDWPQPPTDQYDPYERQHRASIQKAKRTSRQPPSITSVGSHHQPTPPLTPSSMEFRHTPERESRFMAVTKQEEALLEALRQKRARMREEIIEEHETGKTPSPPRIPERSASRYSSASTTNTIRGGGPSRGNQRVLLYLDSPISTGGAIDAPEPSPDLSDFLSFGSDENSTPRNSWAAPSKNREGKARPDFFVAPYSGGDKYAPATPPSAARLSAVGAAGGLSNKRRNAGAVRFMDDHESGVIWGM